MLSILKPGLLLMAMALFFSSCNNGEYTTTKSGLKYRLITEGEGPKPEAGQVMTIHMVYKAGEDTADMFSTVEQGMPIPMPVDSTWKDDGTIYEAFKMLKKGDSMQVEVSAANFFEKTVRQPVPDSISAETPISFTIGVEDVMSMDEYRTFQMEQFKKEQEKMIERGKVQLEKDVQIIEEYLSQNNIQAKTTDSGLRYVVQKEGSGVKADSGDVAKVDFVGKTLEGKVFYTSNEAAAKENNVFEEGNPYEPLEFTVGRGEMIPGVDEGVSLLKEGAKATFFLPSPLAYGERGAGEDIKPNTILMFEVEVLEVKEN